MTATTSVWRPPGEAAPVWLGPVCLVVGIVSWLALGEQLGRHVETMPPAPIAGAAALLAPAPRDPAPEPATGGSVNRSGDQNAEAEEVTAAPTRECAPTLRFAFERGDARLTDVPAPAVEAFVAWVQSRPDAHVVVEGHASADGARWANLQLSHKRAQVVREALEERGVAGDHVEIQAFGAYRPTLHGEGAAADRRVIVRVAGISACSGVEPQ